MSEYKTFLKLHKNKSNGIYEKFQDSFPVIYCDYEFTKPINRKGEAEAPVKAGNIKLAFAMIPNPVIMDWLFDVSRKESGEITTLDSDEGVLEKIAFEKARIVGFRFHYELSSTQRPTTIITLNAQSIAIGDNNIIN